MMLAMMTRFLFILLSLTLVLTVSASGEDCSSEDLLACMDEVLGKQLVTKHLRMETLSGLFKDI